MPLFFQPIVCSVSRGLAHVALYLRQCSPKGTEAGDLCSLLWISRGWQRTLKEYLLSNPVLKNSGFINSPSLLAPLPSSPWYIVHPSSASLCPWPLCYVTVEAGLQISLPIGTWILTTVVVMVSVIKHRMCTLHWMTCKHGKIWSSQQPHEIDF